jgi:MYXO-CTERM domain-containing protein
VSIYGLHPVSNNVIEVDAPGDHVWDVEVDADDPAVIAAVVVQRGDAVERVDLEGGFAQITTTEDDDTLLLVVAGTSTERSDSTEYPYSYRLTPTDPPRCGCATTPAATSPMAVGLALLLGRRRRRWRSS